MNQHQAAIAMEQLGQLATQVWHQGDRESYAQVVILIRQLEARPANAIAWSPLPFALTTLA